MSGYQRRMGVFGCGRRLWMVVPRSQEFTSATSSLENENFDEIVKGLTKIVNLWDTMTNEDIFGEFKRWNEPLSYYWKGGQVNNGFTDINPTNIIEWILAIFKVWS